MFRSKPIGNFDEHSRKCDTFISFIVRLKLKYACIFFLSKWNGRPLSHDIESMCSIQCNSRSPVASGWHGHWPNHRTDCKRINFYNKLPKPSCLWLKESENNKKSSLYWPKRPYLSGWIHVNYITFKTQFSSFTCIAKKRLNYTKYSQR